MTEQPGPQIDEPVPTAATVAGNGTAAEPAPGTGTTADPATPHATITEPGRGTVAERAGSAVDRAGDAMERAAHASGRIASTVVDRLRNDAEFTADRGTTRIEDEVVEKIAGIAAREVTGVHDLGGDTTRFFAAVRERVGLGESDRGNRGVSVRLDGAQARIGVTLVIEYGVKVHPVTEAVRAGVIKAVEEMLDVKVVEVNIVVDDVHVPDPTR